tara:strand:+ start:662 stop:844 length:183 start_codon:yes stop_codon:yes gene_type:complete
MKKEIIELIKFISIGFFKLLTKLKCACCNSTCVIDKSSEINLHDINIDDEVFKTSENKEE